MAIIKPLSQFILSWEGGYVNDPSDRGGATNKGVTLSTWKAQGYDINHDGKIDVEDLKLITDQNAIDIMKKNYWDKWKADQIDCQAIANLLVDWYWSSGSYAITIPQTMLGCKADGVVGPQTLEALNSLDPWVFFDCLHRRRKQFLENICISRPANNKFLNGWLRRLNSIHWTALTCNNGRVITFDQYP